MELKANRKIYIMCLLICSLLILELFSVKIYSEVPAENEEMQSSNMASVSGSLLGKVVIKEIDLKSEVVDEFAIFSYCSIRKLRPLSRSNSDFLLFALSVVVLVYLTYILKIYKYTRKRDLSPIIDFIHEADGMK